jgi:hypothetical protein
MRAHEFMTLQEDAPNALLQSVEQATKMLYGWVFNGVPDEAEQFYGTDDRDELVRIVYADLMKTFRSGKATIYRVINAPDEIIAALRPGMTLGPHDDPNKPASWTLAPEELVMSAIEVERIHGNLTNFFLLEVAVSLVDVNIPVTLAQNIHVHWEQEVALQRGRAIRLTSIHRWSEHRGTGVKVRPDLAGAMMRS